MPLDSESRWRLVRKLKAREAEVDPSVEDITLRSATAEDMKQIAEIYNYYVTNSVVTFDIEATTEATWTEKLEYLWLTVILLRVQESFGCYVSLCSVRSARGLTALGSTNRRWQGQSSG